MHSAAGLPDFHNYSQCHETGITVHTTSQCRYRKMLTGNSTTTALA